MELETAIQLLHNGVDTTSGTPQTWADLGCGTGTFTRALAALLPPQSLLHAVDLDAAALAQIPEQYEAVLIQKHVADFATNVLPLGPLDGVLMANSLHFVRDQKAFLEKMQPLLKPGGTWLLVEYDTYRANRWVPFPLSFESLQRLFSGLGYGSVERLGSVDSVFNRSKIYAALVRR